MHPLVAGRCKRKISVITSMYRGDEEHGCKTKNNGDMSLFEKKLVFFHEKGLHKSDSFGTLKQVYILYLTIPVTSASAERSFSTLRQLKSYLRTTMTDTRVSNLGILQIEKEHKMNLYQIIEQYARAKDRKLQFIV